MRKDLRHSIATLVLFVYALSVCAIGVLHTHGVSPNPNAASTTSPFDAKSSSEGFCAACVFASGHDHIDVASVLPTLAAHGVPLPVSAPTPNPVLTSELPARAPPAV